MPPSPEPVRVAAIVLAAGASTRMERNKMRLVFDGEPLVRRAARRALEAGLSPVVVVLGRDVESVRAAVAGLPCEFAFNPDFAGPTSGSLHVGIRALPPEVEAAVVLLGDMIHVTDEMIRQIVHAAGRTAAPAVVSRYGKVEAPPLLFRRPLFAELLACVGDGCGKQIVSAHRAEAAVVEFSEAALKDLDTPQDLAAARAGRAMPDR